MTEQTEQTKWEDIIPEEVARLRVPGGWIYRAGWGSSITLVFVPEPYPAQTDFAAKFPTYLTDLVRAADRYGFHLEMETGSGAEGDFPKSYVGLVVRSGTGTNVASVHTPDLTCETLSILMDDLMRFVRGGDEQTDEVV